MIDPATQAAELRGLATALREPSAFMPDAVREAMAGDLDRAAARAERFERLLGLPVEPRATITYRIDEVPRRSGKSSALVVSPDCEQGKHTACTGDAWDHDRDAPAVCRCSCWCAGGAR